MNIKDVGSVRAYPPKVLEAIIHGQKYLMPKYDEIEAANGLLITPDCPVNLDDPKGQARIKDFMWRVTEELGEAANCLKNKPWKQTHMPTDIDHFNEELSDALHFFIELLILAGLDTEEKVYDLYHRKNVVNQFRQESRYD